MDWGSIIVAVLAFAGTAIGGFGGFRLLSHRVNVLEKATAEYEKAQIEVRILYEKLSELSSQIAKFERKIDEHNGWGRRLPVMEEKQKVTEHRLADLEEAVRK